MKRRRLLVPLAVASPAPASAHVSEGALVLLLPTEIYAVAGVWTVALTVVVLAVAPQRWFAWGAKRIGGRLPAAGATATSLFATVFFLSVCWVGLAGPRDPLANPLPLLIWTVWWIALLLAQGVVGDLWRWLNPWTGLHRLIGVKPTARLPDAIGAWPALAAFVAFGVFVLADPAPDDPARLARFALAYWATTMAGLIVFGEAWLERCEFMTMLARLLARMAPLGNGDDGLRIGPPGWRLAAGVAPPASAALALAFLGFGSFDGLNETFWWLGFIGVNPLEFPGRSAVVVETTAGLLAIILGLVAVFAACVWLGLKLAGGTKDVAGGAPTWRAFVSLAPTVLPIAFAYHFAHYLVVLMINGQYALAAATDPFGRGDDWLGVGASYVTTGFLNDTASVERIFQAQAGAVVAGHVLSVFLAHAVAARLFGPGRRATISQIPLALFMIAYTFLGLWLLAAPKGA